MHKVKEHPKTQKARDFNMKVKRPGRQTSGLWSDEVLEAWVQEASRKVVPAEHTPTTSESKSCLQLSKGVNTNIRYRSGSSLSSFFFFATALAACKITTPRKNGSIVPDMMDCDLTTTHEYDLYAVNKVPCTATGGTLL